MNPGDQPNPPGTGSLRNGNHRGNPNAAPRCGDKNRARIAAAQDRGGYRSKELRPILDNVRLFARRARIFAAMGAACMDPLALIPILAEVRATLGVPDPGALYGPQAQEANACQARCSTSPAPPSRPGS